MFHDFSKWLVDSSGLMLTGGSEIGDNMFGVHRSIMIVDSTSTTLSLHYTEGSIIWVSTWASDNGMCGSKLGFPTWG